MDMDWVSNPTQHYALNSYCETRNGYFDGYQGAEESHLDSLIKRLATMVEKPPPSTTQVYQSDSRCQWTQPPSYISEEYPTHYGTDFSYNQGTDFHYGNIGAAYQATPCHSTYNQAWNPNFSSQGPDQVESPNFQHSGYLDHSMPMPSMDYCTPPPPSYMFNSFSNMPHPPPHGFYENNTTASRISSLENTMDQFVTSCHNMENQFSKLCTAFYNSEREEMMPSPSVMNPSGALLAQPSIPYQMDLIEHDPSPFHMDSSTVQIGSPSLPPLEPHCQDNSSYALGVGQDDHFNGSLEVPCLSFSDHFMEEEDSPLPLQGSNEEPLIEFSTHVDMPIEDEVEEVSSFKTFPDESTHMLLYIPEVTDISFEIDINECKENVNYDDGGYLFSDIVNLPQHVEPIQPLVLPFSEPPIEELLPPNEVVLKVEPVRTTWITNGIVLQVISCHQDNYQGKDTPVVTAHHRMSVSFLRAQIFIHYGPPRALIRPFDPGGRFFLFPALFSMFFIFSMH